MYRPVATPHYGGIVERLIGTLMRRVHELEGTTFSSVAERGKYDSDARAAMTLAELERWIGLVIAGQYHREVHSGLSEPPSVRWERGVQTHGHPRAVANNAAFLIDFLPIIRRRITRAGIRINHLFYFSNAMQPWIANRDRLNKLVVRRDPRDLSRIYVLDPLEGFYVEVPCAWQERPSISLFEHRQATAKLKADGRSAVDEEAIFRTVAAQRLLADQASSRTRSARRRRARQPREENAHRTVGELQPTSSQEIVVDELYEAETW